jgi:hypothetical protein
MAGIKKMIEIDEEDIGNLKNAEERIFKTLNYNNENYEALEIFTILDIIKRWNKC